MKSIKFFMMIAALVGGLSFTGCSSDDDIVSSSTITVGENASKDFYLRECSIYDLPVNIQSEVGLKLITVEDGNGHERCRIDDFENSKNITSLPIDFSDCIDDETFSLTIKATDNSGKTITSDPISLNVIYHPVLKATVENSVTLFNPATIKVKINRGMNTLLKAVVKVDDLSTTKFILTINGGNDDIYDLTINLPELQTGANTVTLELYEKGVTDPVLTKTATVNYIDPSSNKLATLYLTQDDIHYSISSRKYNSDGTLKWIVFRKTPDDSEKVSPEEYWAYFSYSDGKLSKLKVTKVRYEYREGQGYQPVADPDNGNDPFEDDYCTYQFTYSDYMLTSVTKDGASYISNVEYDDNSQIKSYDVNGLKTGYTPIYDTETHYPDICRLDYQDANLTGKQFVASASMIKNPFYVALLPAVIPGDICDIPLQFLYNKYLYSFDGWSGWTVDYGVENATISSSYKIGDKTFDASFTVY